MTVEHASFLPSDPEPLVEASLACPMCLHSVQWSLAGTGSQAAIVCRCTECGQGRTVALTGAQVLRLAVLDEDAGHLFLPAGLGAIAAR